MVLCCGAFARGLNAADVPSPSSDPAPPREQPRATTYGTSARGREVEAQGDTKRAGRKASDARKDGKQDSGEHYEHAAAGQHRVRTGAKRSLARNPQPWIRPGPQEVKPAAANRGHAAERGGAAGKPPSPSMNTANIHRPAFGESAFERRAGEPGAHSASALPVNPVPTRGSGPGAIGGPRSLSGSKGAPIANGLNGTGLTRRP